MKIKELIESKILKRAVLFILVAAIISGSGIVLHKVVANSETETINKAISQKTEQMKSDFKQEVGRYETVLSSVAQLFNSSEMVSQAQFTNFVNGLKIDKTYPGVKGLAYLIKVGPNDANTVNTQSLSQGIDLKAKVADNESEKAVLYYVIPEDKQVPSGLNVYLIPGGKDALEYGVKNNLAAATAPIQYIIDSKPTVGFVMAYPSIGGAPIKLDSQKTSANTGWILTFIDTSKIFNNVSSRDFSLLITDHDDTKLKSNIKTENPSKYSNKFSMEIGGRTLDFVATPDKKFVNSVSDSSKASKYTFFLLNAEIALVMLCLILWMHKSRRNKELNMSHQITHDTLTGLPNRAYLEKWMNAKASSESNKDKIAVLFIDLDGFKAINDTLGHQSGDRFLVAVSQRLQNEIRGNDILARLGGDEFIVVLDQVEQEIQAVRIAERLLEVVRFPVTLDSGPVCVSASIGIAISSIDVSNSADAIIRFADAAMYAAKQDRNNRIRVFDNKLKSIVDGRHEVESSIKGASARGEIVDVLQPIISVHNGETFGYEALCRWNHPNFGIIGPDQFLDAAKVTGEIIEIDSWMVNKAFTNALEIAESTKTDCRVWVNLSVRHLLQGDFYKHVMTALKNSPAKANMIGVEIEESVFKVDSGLLYPFLNQLRDLGIPIGLDDFGAEEASLQALKKYDYDVIKLGRNLVNDFIEEPSTSIIPAVIQLAKGSGAKVVATGVETPEALQKIIDVGCDLVQGYVFSKPQPIEDLIDVSPNFKWPMPLGFKKHDEEEDSSNVREILNKKSS